MQRFPARVAPRSRSRSICGLVAGSGLAPHCPHAALREDISHNLLALDELMESGGNNVAAPYGRELADYTVYVIDVAGGDKVPRKGGPGITQSDLLVVNKTDLAPQVGADLAVMERDARRMRGSGPIVFA